MQFDDFFFQGLEVHLDVLVKPPEAVERLEAELVDAEDVVLVAVVLVAVGVAVVPRRVPPPKPKIWTQKWILT